MSSHDWIIKIIGTLNVLHKIDNIEIIKYAIESLIEELEDLLDHTKEQDRETNKK